MTSVYKQACLVEVAPRATWRRLSDSSQSSNKELTYSASGLLLFLDSAYVITHGSILLSHFSKNKELAKLRAVNFLNRNIFKDLQALVTIENRPKADASSSYVEEAPVSQPNALVNVTSSSVPIKPEQYSGSVECMWKANKFAKAVQSFLPSSESWSFFEEPAEKTDNSDIDPQLVAQLLPYFILIKLDGAPIFINHGHLMRDRLTIGDTVHMVGTPFGAMSPSVFLNSVSEGIVCNMAGSNQELIVTDARCIPGTEGGPLYLGDAKQSECLVGLVASALCWKANEWIGLSLACHIRDILHSLQQHNQLPQLNYAMNRSNPQAALTQTWSITTRHRPHSDLAIGMVRSQGSWGSGLMVDHKQGVMVTCGHVISGQKTARVRLDKPEAEWFDADVIHATPVNQAYDIGVLKLRGYRPIRDWPTRVRIAESVEEGEDSFVLGHAIFGQQHKLPAMMTSGVISKVIRSQGQPVLIQSTCTVNAGASGGALISADGSVYGIVSCNAKDTVTGACYPNINLVVPLKTIWSTIQHYIDYNDVSVLKGLCLDNKDILDLWSMHGSERNFDVIRSKL